MRWRVCSWAVLAAVLIGLGCVTTQHAPFFRETFEEEVDPRLVPREFWEKDQVWV